MEWRMDDRPMRLYDSLSKARLYLAGPVSGGEGGIRTPGTREGTTDFESVTFGHSATSPSERGEDFFHEPKMASLRKPNLVIPLGSHQQIHNPCGSAVG